MEVILRNDVVESARAGDEMTFVGTLLVVPHVAAITAPGEKVQTKPGLHFNEVVSICLLSIARSCSGMYNSHMTMDVCVSGQGGYQGQGISGLKMLGCRDLTYRHVFLASATQVIIQLSVSCERLWSCFLGKSDG